MLIGHLNDGKKGKQNEMEPSEILRVTEWLKEGTKGKLDWLQSGGRGVERLLSQHCGVLAQFQPTTGRFSQLSLSEVIIVCDCNCSGT